jgi:hypothetical protein
MLQILDILVSRDWIGAIHVPFDLPEHHDRFSERWQIRQKWKIGTLLSPALIAISLPSFGTFVFRIVLYLIWVSTSWADDMNLHEQRHYIMKLHILLLSSICRLEYEILSSKSNEDTDIDEWRIDFGRDWHRPNITYRQSFSLIPIEFNSRVIRIHSKTF